MKRITSFALLVIVTISSFFLIACRNPVEPDHASPDPESLVISGSVSSLGKSLTGPKDVAFDPADIRSVLLLYANSYESHDVTNGRFSFSPSKFVPAGMVFIGAGSNYLGCAKFSDGGNTLPLHALGSGRRIIDLGPLACDGQTASTTFAALQDFDPAKGNGARFSAASKLFESVIRNPDFDGNGVVDVLEGKRIRITTLFYISDYASFLDDSATSVTFASLSKATIGSSKFLFSVKSSGIGTDAAVLTMPDNTTKGPVAGIATSAGAQYFIATGSGLPPSGSYNFARAGVSYNFTVTPENYSEDNIVLIVPSVSLNGDGTVKGIAWACLDDAFQSINSPEQILTDLQIQIDVKPERVGDYTIVPGSNACRVYDSPFVTVSGATHVLGVQGIKWTDVSTIYMTYNDLFGNHYVNSFGRPSP
jgi:hypothetical protein